MTWAKLDDQFFSHRKVIDLSKDAKLLFLAGVTYCAGQLTDGLITPGALRMIAAQVDVAREIVQEVAQELLSAGMWETHEAGYLVHDYLVYNPSAEDVLRERAKTAERVANFRQRKRARTQEYYQEEEGHPAEGRNGVTSPVTHAVSNGVGTASPSPSPYIHNNSEDTSNRTFVAAVDTAGDEERDGRGDPVFADASLDGVQPNGKKSGASASTRRKRPDPLPAESVPVRLATLLRDRILAHTPSAASVQRAGRADRLQNWSRVFDLMLRQDHYSSAEIEAVIDFATTDEFWRANILSPGSLREQYDRLNIKRQQRDERLVAANGHSPRHGPGHRGVYSAARRAAIVPDPMDNGPYAHLVTVVSDEQE